MKKKFNLRNPLQMITLLLVLKTNWRIWKFFRHSRHN